jgi:hypothetical protein
MPTMLKESKPRLLAQSVLLGIVGALLSCGQW